mgnify:CR=1 FL=1
MWILLFSSMALADESVITLKKGQRAPWDGTLLSPEAAAKIIVDTDSELEKCLIDSRKDLALQEAKLTLEKNNVEAKLAACTLRQVESKILYENQIQFLEKQAITQKWEAPVYYTLGILTGAGIVYGSSLILKNIGQ